MHHPQAVPAATARPVRTRRPGRLVVAVVVLLGLLVGVDRVSLLVAERIAGTTFQKSQHLNQAPSVSVGGFPFLTQLAASEFDDVTVSVSGLVVGQPPRTLRIRSLAVHLHGVRVADSFHIFRATSATADAAISYGDLSRTLGAEISYAGSPAAAGRIKASKTVTLAGVSITGEITSQVHASSADGLTFPHPRLAVGGQPLPTQVTDALSAVFARPIPLGELSFGVQVRGVDATPASLVVHLSGTNLTYSRS